ncbi:DNA alkylation repair protein [Polyangium jinanense]|uniref:DNA alkylation repair protein n=1 Tax=Polyangium jinanense TaxID=2829994 RepID=A0A9X3XCP3_9BACT|nr:DNA alkylation repair protein [Polyangium jinanense]MDC3987972.1 DNA alkylation repair protein [Polyangium jinanense]
MAEPLKNFFDERLVRRIAASIQAAWPDFPARSFIAEARAGLDDKELKARGHHIAAALGRALPDDFERAVDILLRSLATPASRDEGAMSSFFYLPHLTFVAERGLDHFEASMRAQHALTQVFTAEFSIRPFLLRDPVRTLARLRTWATDPSTHVRRLVSEGTRPRLPWAERLPAFIEDPTPVLELLELLKDDPEAYVRNSVANNLNDIAKDHPDRVVALCRRWMEGAGPGRTWIVQHALRWLVKRGHPGALALFGASAAPEIVLECASVTPPKVSLGEEARFSCELVSRARSAQKLVVDAVIHYPGATGKSRPKVFKLRKIELLPSGRERIEGRVKLVDLTTRRHYPGEHRIELRINGVDFSLGQFLAIASRGGETSPSARAKPEDRGNKAASPRRSRT